VPSFSYTLEQILSAMDRKGYAVFRREYDLNIIGIRSTDLQPNTFNDWIVAAHLRSNGTWACYPLQATTDPGVKGRLSPGNPKGIGAIVPGQYRGLWKLGLHKGSPALVQSAPVKLYRDNDRDAVLEFVPSHIDSGMFGIDLHGARKTIGASELVDGWSEGCQVLAANEDLQFVLRLVELQATATGHNAVSYTLLNESDIV